MGESKVGLVRRTSPATASQAQHAGGHYLVVLDHAEAEAVCAFVTGGGDPATFMARFGDVKPRLAGLRHQVIHNDYHLFNVLVAQDDASRVTGIIDFGDMIRAPLVAEVATAAAYQLRGTDDPDRKSTRLNSSH